jgi:hypothetical protein
MHFNPQQRLGGCENKTPVAKDIIISRLKILESSLDSAH